MRPAIRADIALYAIRRCHLRLIYIKRVKEKYISTHMHVFSTKHISFITPPVISPCSALPRRREESGLKGYLYRWREYCRSACIPLKFMLLTGIYYIYIPLTEIISSKAESRLIFLFSQWWRSRRTFTITLKGYLGDIFAAAYSILTFAASIALSFTRVFIESNFERYYFHAEY